MFLLQRQFLNEAHIRNALDVCNTLTFLISEITSSHSLYDIWNLICIMILYWINVVIWTTLAFPIGIKSGWVSRPNFYFPLFADTLKRLYGVLGGTCVYFSLFNRGVLILQLLPCILHSIIFHVELFILLWSVCVLI